MTILTTITRRIATAAYLIENPRLFKLFHQGGFVKTFLTLNQPWFHELKIATILDIGANTGQFAITMSFLLPKAQIYSFEPLPECFEQLKKRMKRVQNFSAFNVGLGEYSGSLEFECNSFVPSSSFLKMAELHKKEFPYTRKSQTINVKVERLDALAEKLVIIEPLMLKIDVQGYENKVLRGGEYTIKQAKIILIETSFEMLYEGQPLFDEIYRQLIDWGFVYRGILDQTLSPQTKRILQADSIFLKSS